MNTVIWADSGGLVHTIHFGSERDRAEAQLEDIKKEGFRVAIVHSPAEMQEFIEGPVGDEVFVIATPRKDGNMPGFEKTLGERGTECTLYYSAEAAAREMDTYDGFCLAVFRARLVIEERIS